MRPVLHGDISAAVRALLCVPRSARQQVFDRMIIEAEAADKFRKSTGRAHPAWGNGSLMAAANLRQQAPEPMLDDTEYCSTMALAFDQLLAWRLAQRARGRAIT